MVPSLEAVVFEGGSYVPAEDGEHLRERWFGTVKGDVLFLCPYETVYLVEKGELRAVDSDGEEMSVDDLIEAFSARREGFERAYVVFRDLRDMGYVVKSGFKFGGHFRVYEGDPDSTHSDWVVVVTGPEGVLTPRDVLRATRLAASVRKTFVLAVVEDVESPEIRYVRLERVRL